MDAPARRWTPWLGAALVGVARADISPPTGLPARNWAARTTPVNTGRHRPLTATAVAAVRAGGGDPADAAGARSLLIGLDLGWWRRAEDEARLRDRVLAATGLPAEAVLVHLVHTHAGPYTAAEPETDEARPVAEYLDALVGTVAGIAVRALGTVEPATTTWSYGRCGLAVNRDLPVGGRDVVAFNPDRDADDTLLVGRVTAADGRPLATLVNYACHPTTLSWRNSLVSPDSTGSVPRGKWSSPPPTRRAWCSRARPATCPRATRRRTTSRWPTATAGWWATPCWPRWRTCRSRGAHWS